MRTQKSPLQFHYKQMHFVEKKNLNQSIKLSCATDPALPRNKIRPQMSTIQHVTPNNFLSQDITNSCLWSQKLNILTVQKRKQNMIQLTIKHAQVCCTQSFSLSCCCYVLENIGDFTQCEKYIQQLD